MKNPNAIPMRTYQTSSRILDYKSKDLKMQILLILATLAARYVELENEHPTIEDLIKAVVST
jgi:hypothetical protein